MASAPSAAASIASSGRVMPQILTRGVVTLVRPVPSSCRLGEHQPRQRVRPGSRPSVMNRSPIRNASISQPPQPRQIVGGLQTALGDRDHARRNRRRQLVEQLGAHLQRAEIPAVDADERRAGVERALELVAIVHFDERGEAQTSAASASQRAQFRVRQRRDDEQHRIGAARRGLDTWKSRDDEVLAQERELDGARARARR